MDTLAETSDELAELAIETAFALLAALGGTVLELNALQNLTGDQLLLGAWMTYMGLVCFYWAYALSGGLRERVGSATPA